MEPQRFVRQPKMHMSIPKDLRQNKPEGGKTSERWQKAEQEKIGRYKNKYKYDERKTEP